MREKAGKDIVAAIIPKLQQSDFSSTIFLEISTHVYSFGFISPGTEFSYTVSIIQLAANSQSASRCLPFSSRLVKHGISRMKAVDKAAVATL